MTAQDVINLRELLQKMRKEDPRCRIFAATLGHKYLLKPPLSEAELSDFERKHRIALPEDYRFFLNHVGNGGAGPGYGLTPLEKTLGDCDPSMTFPLAEPPRMQPVVGKAEWGNDGTPFPGLLEICHHGCAYFSFLMINGPARGTVWEAELETMQFFPTGLTFEGWYRRWADSLIERALPMIARERVVDQVKVGMTKAEVIGICGGVGGKWEERSFSKGNPSLRFERLASSFEIDESGVVVRIFRHYVPSWYPWES